LEEKGTEVIIHSLTRTKKGKLFLGKMLYGSKGGGVTRLSGCGRIGKRRQLGGRAQKKQIYRDRIKKTILQLYLSLRS